MQSAPPLDDAAPTAPASAPASFAIDAESRGADFWILLRGELDLATDDQLRVALSSLRLAPEGVIWLHLAELHFVDAASLRQLVDFTRHVRAAGRQVAVNGIHGVVRRMTDLLGLEEELAVA